MGNRKGLAGLKKNKTSINQVYIVKSKHQLIKTRYAKAFKQEWKSFSLLNNPVLYTLRAAVYTFSIGPLKRLK